MIVSCDGAARGTPGPAGIGVVVATPGGEVLAAVGEGIGVATNNVAEYRAALRGLELARAHGATDVVLRSDSKLLVEQLLGRWQVRNPSLMRLHDRVRALQRGFRSVRFEHVPRARNAEADTLANRGVDDWLAGPGRGHTRPRPAPRLFPTPPAGALQGPASILSRRRSRPGGRGSGKSSS